MEGGGGTYTKASDSPMLSYNLFFLAFFPYYLPLALINVIFAFDSAYKSCRKIYTVPGLALSKVG